MIDSNIFAIYISIVQILTMTGDLSLDEDCKTFVTKTIDQFKRLDVLVANAGINGVGNVQTVLMEDHDRIMNTNCRAVLIMLKLCVPHLIETKGNVVITSSILEFRAVKISLSCFFTSVTACFCYCKNALYLY